MPAKTSKRKFEYHSRSREDVKARANMRGGNFDDFVKGEFKKYKVKEGKNLIRILPPTWGPPTPKHFGFDLWLNYNIGADNQCYLSLSKMKGEPDPLADARKQAQRDGNRDLVKALDPKLRVGYWVIDRMNEDEGPQFWAAPLSFDKDLANLSTDDDTKEVVEIDEPDTGRDVRFFTAGKGLLTKYDAAKMRLLPPSPLHEDEQQATEWLDFVLENPIPECLNYYPFEYIEASFDGQVTTAKDADDAEKQPPKTQPASRHQAVAPAADDDLEDPDSGDEVDDETERKPKSTVKAKHTNGEAEEDEEEENLPEDEDDDDQDEKEVLRTKAGKAKTPAKPDIRERLKNRRQVQADD